jgi:hypothetical protein
VKHAKECDDLKRKLNAAFDQLDPELGRLIEALPAESEFLDRWNKVIFAYYGYLGVAVAYNALSEKLVEELATLYSTNLADLDVQTASGQWWHRTFPEDFCGEAAANAGAGAWSSAADSK